MQSGRIFYGMLWLKKGCFANDDDDDDVLDGAGRVILKWILKGCEYVD
jgi:hypothetical protein